MQRYPLFRGLLLAAALGVPLAASAQQTAYATNQLNLRAGPGPEYPVVGVLAPGAGVVVQGCVAGYQWCDVDAGGPMRGWVYAQYLSYSQSDGAVPFANAAVNIGIPVLAFTLGTYWASHYRDRPWYHHPQWQSHPPRPRPPSIRPPHPRPPPGVRPPPPRPPVGVRPPPPRPPGARPPPRPQRPDAGPPPRPHPVPGPVPGPGGHRPGRPGGNGHQGGGHGRP